MHPVPQLISPGLLVTVPAPDPPLVTVRVGPVLKVAVIDLSPSMLTVHVPVPLQPPPLQPIKVDPLAALAVKVTELPLL